MLLMQLGAKHVESPFIEFGQLTTMLYFLYFSVIIFYFTFFENTVINILYSLKFLVNRAYYCKELFMYHSGISSHPTLRLFSHYTVYILLLLILISLVIFTVGGIDSILCDTTDLDSLTCHMNDSEGVTSVPVPGRRCPACLERGDTVWVIPGKCCPQCGTPVN